MFDAVAQQQPEPVLKGGQQGRNIGPEQGLGMGFKGDGGGLRAHLLCQPDTFGKQSLMPQMHPVKEAQGKDSFILIQTGPPNKRM